jgi:5-methylcytosine-specific restriction endonuclease McrA
MARLQFEDSLPPKSRIFDHWKDQLPQLRILIDWGEPSCWACGFHYGTRHDIKCSSASWQEICRGWDRIPLQRCHIVARSLGGKDEVSNLFLMCRECHDRAPNTTIPAIFFEWARAQSWDSRESAKILDALRAFGIDELHCEGFEILLESEDFRSWMRGKFGLHRPQSNYAPVSSRLTPATIVGLAVYFQRMSGVFDNPHADQF